MSSRRHIGCIYIYIYIYMNSRPHIYIYIYMSSRPQDVGYRKFLSNLNGVLYMLLTQNISWSLLMSSPKFIFFSVRNLPHTFRSAPANKTQDVSLQVGTSDKCGSSLCFKWYCLPTGPEQQVPFAQWTGNSAPRTAHFISGFISVHARSCGTGKLQILRRPLLKPFADI